VIALVAFPFNAIVVVEIEQSMRVLLPPTSLHSSVWIVRLLRLPSVSLQPYYACGSTIRYSTRRTGSVMMSSHLACPFPSCLHKMQNILHLMHLPVFSYICSFPVTCRDLVTVKKTLFLFFIVPTVVSVEFVAVF
jgi:hypothetical protein